MSNARTASQNLLLHVDLIVLTLMKHVMLKVVSYSEAASDIQSIRHTVFQIEQGVDPEIEFDGQDDAATHIVAYLETQPIGTTRIRFLQDGLAKIERVAVLAKYRGRGIGKTLMQEAIAWLRTKQVPEVKINAQTHAKAFYEKLGFQQRGDEFDEAGIPHIEMRKSLM